MPSKGQMFGWRSGGNPQREETDQNASKVSEKMSSISHDSETLSSVTTYENTVPHTRQEMITGDDNICYYRLFKLDWSQMHLEVTVCLYFNVNCLGCLICARLIILTNDFSDHED